MTTTSLTNLARAAGILIGAGLAACLLIADRPSDGVSRLPASARFSVLPTGELQMTPPTPRPVLSVPALTPGGRHATASFALRNQTGKTLALSFRARAGARTLDGLLRIRLSAGGTALADTTLQGLRQGSSSLRLPSGAERRIEIEAWIPDGVGEGYEGRSVSVSLIPILRAGG